MNKLFATEDARCKVITTLLTIAFLLSAVLSWVTAVGLLAWVFYLVLVVCAVIYLVRPTERYEASPSLPETQQEAKHQNGSLRNYDF